jgi:guanosine-3',5'-bis(diphosphate) 3'-pyrophosphohydrolase
MIAALLHDSVEDTGITLEEVDPKQFGAEVAGIVDGVTKLDRIQFDSKEAQQAADHAQDAGGDGQGPAGAHHQARRPPAQHAHHRRHARRKQERIAHETLDIYAPLAHRLGMQELKQQLEDLSFAVAAPQAVRRDRPHGRHPAPPSASCTWSRCSRRCASASPSCNIDGRGDRAPEAPVEHLREDGREGSEFDDIFDLVGIRVIVDSVKDCYAALGSIHATWTPVQGRFKDYVAMPKFNLYQSLHTTVIGPQGKPVEVQIRTREMHQRAEFGRGRPLRLQDRFTHRRAGLAEPHRRLAGGDATPPSSWRT